MTRCAWAGLFVIVGCSLLISIGLLIGSRGATRRHQPSQANARGLCIPPSACPTWSLPFPAPPTGRLLNVLTYVTAAVMAAGPRHFDLDDWYPQQFSILSVNHGRKTTTRMSPPRARHVHGEGAEPRGSAPQHIRRDRWLTVAAEVGHGLVQPRATDTHREREGDDLLRTWLVEDS